MLDTPQARPAGVRRCRIKMTVDVLQWTGTNTDEVGDFLATAWTFNRDTNGRDCVMFLDKHGVPRVAVAGDYLVRGHEGNVFPVTPATYAADYEPVDGPAPDNSPEGVLERYRAAGGVA